MESLKNNLNSEGDPGLDRDSDDVFTEKIRIATESMRKQVEKNTEEIVLLQSTMQQKDLKIWELESKINRLIEEDGMRRQVWMASQQNQQRMPNVQQVPQYQTPPTNWMAYQYTMQQQPNRPPSASQLYVQPAPQQQTTPTPTALLVKNILRIYDPNASEDKPDDILGADRGEASTPPQSGTATPRSTPNTQSGQSAFAAQFAQQVAATLNPQHDAKLVVGASHESESPDDQSTEIVDQRKAYPRHQRNVLPESDDDNERREETKRKKLLKYNYKEGGKKQKKQKQRIKLLDEKGKVMEDTDKDVFLVPTLFPWFNHIRERKEHISGGVMDEDLETEELLRKVRGLLNKLTPQEFNRLLSQIQELDINTEERLTGVVDLVFEMAIHQPKFSVPYALLCQTLARNFVTRPGGELLTFRVKIMARCQEEFEKDREEEIDLGRRQAEIEAAETKEKKAELILSLDDAKAESRRRSIGNIVFMGELFKLKMFTEEIMLQCLSKLLDSGGEEDLECLCQLLTTIGMMIDATDEAKDRIDTYFKRMRQIIDNKESSSRMRFLMLDVIDLRNNNWVNRRTPNDPTTIDQIHQEAALEKQRGAAQEQQNRQNIKLNKPRRGKQRAGLKV